MTRFDDRTDDPRPAPTDRESAAARGQEGRPVVAGRAAHAVPWVAIGGGVLLGCVVLAALAARRSHDAGDVETATPARAVIAAPPTPTDLAMVEAEGRISAFPVTGPQAPSAPPPVQVASPLVVPSNAGANASGALEAVQRLHAPSLVIDLTGGAEPSSSGAYGTIGQPAGGAATSAALKPAANQLSSDEQFSDRIGTAQPEHASATLLRNQHALVPQGTMIPAVLETAMNSDLPGFVRAVVSRDVRGFDGSSVLIPRGSRLVGQYRSGLSEGASRILVIWTRLLRPDGASVQIASPGGDPLGRAGQEGKVHSHFLRQFANSILLSVIGAEVSNLAAQPSTQIVIGGAAGGLASSAPPLLAPPGAYGTTGTTTGTPGGTTSGGSGYPPTITVKQGAPISIFVARDLDFSTVPTDGK